MMGATLLWFLLCFLYLVTLVESGPLNTFAGTGNCIDSVVSKPAINGTLKGARTVWVNSLGDIYIADSSDNRIRMVSSVTGEMVVVAGNGYAQYFGETDIPATSSPLPGIRGLVGDLEGNLYLVSSNFHIVRIVYHSNATISRYAGKSGVAGSSGDNGLALLATLNSPRGLFMDSSQQLYIADFNNHKVRKIDLMSRIITTAVGTGEGANDYDVHKSIARIHNPISVFVNTIGDLYILEYNIMRIKKVSAQTGMMTLIAGNGKKNFTTDGFPATSISLWYAECLTGDKYGNIYFAHDAYTRVIQVSNVSGNVSTYVGEGNIGYDGENLPRLVGKMGRTKNCFMDTSDALYTTELEVLRVRKYTDVGVTVAGNGKWCDEGDYQPATSANIEAFMMWADAERNLYFSATVAHRVRVVRNDGIVYPFAGTGYFYGWVDEQPATSTPINAPTGVTGDNNGSVYIVDSTRYVRVVQPNGIMRVVAGKGGDCVVTGNYGPAKDAQMCPRAVFYDKYTHYLYVADQSTNTIRKIDLATMIIYPVAGTGEYSFRDNVVASRAAFRFPTDLWVNSLGYVYIADGNNYRLRLFNPNTGNVTTVAGNGESSIIGDNIAATSASLGYFGGICADRLNNLYLVGASATKVRRVDMNTGIISTMAGNGDVQMGFSGDSINPLKSKLGNAQDCVVDEAMVFYLPQIFTNRIRYISILEPTSQPTSMPSSQPSGRPSAVPSGQPSSEPTSPTSQPSALPTAQPYSRPSGQPSSQPSCFPTSQPSGMPSMVPSVVPTSRPSMQPLGRPSSQPSFQPSSVPTDQPLSYPSAQPSCAPSTQPSSQPIACPSGKPSTQPSTQPSSQPSVQPTLQPSGQPSTHPSSQPSVQPTLQPSGQPSAQPSLQPSAQPTRKPSGQPSRQPSAQPSSQPSRQPSAQPSSQPLSAPTSHPSIQPSRQPTAQPSYEPSEQPVSQPTLQPFGRPSSQPSTLPSIQPVSAPSLQPTCQPSTRPSQQPSVQPSKQPSRQPTRQPSSQPSRQPSRQPTRQPSSSPTSTPLDKIKDAKELRQVVTDRMTSLNIRNLSASAVMDILGTSIAAFNRINCTLAPNCNSLRRAACSATPHTCGSCVSGYIGEAGDSNGACVLPSLLTGIANKCTSNSQCKAWEYCKSSSGKCEEKNKDCVRSCSKKGSCTLVSLLDGEAVNSCGYFDTTCEARCNCLPNYAGIDCSFNKTELAKEQHVRSLLLAKFDEALSKLDYSNATLVRQTINLLVNIVRSEFDVNEQSAMFSAQIVEKLLNSTASYHSLAGTLSVLDSVVIATKAQNFSATASANITAATVASLTAFAELVGDAQNVNDPTIGYTEQSFRIASKEVKAGRQMNILLPRAASEVLTNNNPNVEVVSRAVAGKNQSVQAIELSPSRFWPKHSSHSSAPEFVEQQFVSNIISIITSNSKEVVLAIPVVGQIASIPEQVFNTSCRLGIVSAAEYTCNSSGYKVQHSCDGTSLGLFSTVCPQPLPSCRSVDLQSAQVDANSACVASNRTTTSLICTCQLLTSSRRQLTSTSQNTLDTSGVISIGLMVEYIVLDFAGTFKAAKGLSTGDNVKETVIVIVMFAVLWSLGGLTMLGLLWKRMPKQADSKKVRDNQMDAAQSAVNKILVLQKLADYVNTVVPAVYLSTSEFVRVQRELVRHHAYLSLYFGSAIGKRRSYTVLLQLLTIQTMLMFLLAVLYDLQGPDDDGSCVHHVQEDDCVHRKSMFDQKQPYCAWEVDAGTGMTACAYNEMEFTFIVGFYCAIVTSLFTALLMRPLNYLFELLAAPTEESIKASLAASAFQMVASATRRASAMATQLKNVMIPSAPGGHSKHITSTRYIPADTELAYRQARGSVNSIGEKFHNDVVTRISARSSLRKSILDRLRGQSAQPSSTAIVPMTLQSFRDTFRFQRDALQGDALDVFDEGWGLDRTANFPSVSAANGPLAMCGLCEVDKDLLDIIEEEITFVQSTSKRVVERLEIATDSHKGLEILQLFMVDLLGRNTAAAKIFRSKAEEDYQLLPVVSARLKGLVIALVIGINAFFIYYSILRGFAKGLRWQRSYLLACIVQFLVEILLFETLECLWINVVVPSFVVKEVSRIHRVLQAAVQHMCELAELSEEEQDSKFILNTPDYFFVSTNVAKAYPRLMESMIVLGYQTNLPGEIAKQWIEFEEDEDVDGACSSVLGYLWNAMSAASVAAISIVAFVPFEFQRMILRFMQPFFLGGLIYIYLLIKHSANNILIFIAVLCAAFVVLLYQYFNSGFFAQESPILTTAVVAEEALKREQQRLVESFPLARGSKVSPSTGLLVGDDDNLAKEKDGEDSKDEDMDIPLPTAVNGSATSSAKVNSVAKVVSVANDGENDEDDDYDDEDDDVSFSELSVESFTMMDVDEEAPANARRKSRRSILRK